MRLAHAVLSLLVLCSPSPAATTAPTPSRASHEDARLGFKVRVPQGWTRVPVPLGERWIVAKYISDKEYPYLYKATNSNMVHKPQMQVIALPTGSRYDGYAEFLEETLDRGHHIEEETTGKGTKLEARAFDVRLRDAGRRTPAARIAAWSYELDGVQVTVQFLAKEDVFPKIEKELGRCLKSLAPTGAGDESAPAPGSGLFVDLDGLDPKERRQRLEESETELHERALAGLPDGWKAKRNGRFLVLNHSDTDYAKQLAAQGEAVFRWLDEAFPDIAPDRYVRAPILHVCEDDWEKRTMRWGSESSSWNGSGLEIIACKDARWGSQSTEFDAVSMRVMDIWFEEKDRSLYRALPRWIDRGLTDMLADSRAKRGKLVFKDDEGEVEDLREAEQAGTLPSVRDLVLANASEYRSMGAGYEHSGAVIGLLTSRAAAKDRRMKGLLSNYLLHLREVLGEIEAEEEAERVAREKEEEDGKEKKKPATEAEEDAAYQARRSRFATRERRLLDETFERTFAGWDDRDWNALEKTFRKTF